MPRYNSIEREGVNALEKVIIKAFNWVFRDQPFVDVGIDAIVEESLFGNPSGRFLAFQIKSGKSHYHETDDTLTYYLSDVHYYYWTNHSFPVILVLYNPEIEHLYWKEITEKTAVKTAKGWKLQIPKTQILNIEAKDKLKKIMYSFNAKGGFFNQKEIEVTTLGVFEHMINMEKINYIEDSFKYHTQYIKDLAKHTNNFIIKIKELKEHGLKKGDPEANAYINGYADLLNIYSTRLFQETNLFSKMSADGIRSIILVTLIAYKDGKFPEDLIKSIETRIKSHELVLLGMKYLQESHQGLNESYESLKEAKENINLTFSLIIDNISDAKFLWHVFIKALQIKIIKN